MISFINLFYEDSIVTDTIKKNNTASPNSNDEEKMRKKLEYKKARAMRQGPPSLFGDHKSYEDGSIIQERRTFWIPGKLKKGALHKALGVPEGEKLPVEKLEPKEGDSPLLAHRKALARTFRKISKNK